MTIIDETKVDAFWKRVTKTDDCWLWTGSTTTAGYGNLRWAGGFDYAHRVSYTLTVGPIPEGMVVDHLCRVRHCVNPDHLEPVTQKVNVARGLTPYGLRTTCRHGHDITIEANVYAAPGGERRCRVCMNDRNRSRPRSARKVGQAA